MSQTSYILTSDESELLLAFETSPNLEKLSQTLRKDVSNLSRALSRIAEKIPVVAKQNNRWQLTELGRQLNRHSRDSIQFQQTLLQQQSFLRIGTNREFSARILGPHLKELQNLFPNTQLRICAFETGTEKPLLEGLIDIGFDCDRPFSPDISFKLLIPESIIAVCSPAFKKENQSALKEGSFLSLPHLLCDRLLPDLILKKTENKLNVLSTFNDIATARAACIAGNGWALLPKYAVQTELGQKTLVQLDTPEMGESSYGVWWLRSRKFLEPSVKQLKEWLSGIEI